MKVLVVLFAVVASCLAKPGGYVAPASYSYSSSVVSVSRPAVYAAPAPAVYAAPAPVAYTAPASTVVTAPIAPVAYAPAPAPVAYAAPAPVAYAAPVPAPVVAAPAPVAPVAYAGPAPVAYAAPAPVAYAAPAPVVAAAPAAVKSQYHAQNEHGEASYGHAEPGQVHNAVQDAHGNKIGSFSYVNPEGHVLRTDYVADAAGYRVASNALPAAPVAAPLVHARRRRSAYFQTPASTVPLAPVVYSAPAVAPLAYAAPVAPLAYTAPAPVAPAVYAAPAPVAPAVYAAPAPAPAVYAAPAPAILPATLTTVVNNPGHAVSYRVD